MSLDDSHTLNQYLGPGTPSYVPGQKHKAGGGVIKEEDDDYDDEGGELRQQETDEDARRSAAAKAHEASEDQLGDKIAALDNLLETRAHPKTGDMLSAKQLAKVERKKRALIARVNSVRKSQKREL
jgi:hypothetical protein